MAQSQMNPRMRSRCGMNGLAWMHGVEDVLFEVAEGLKLERWTEAGLNASFNSSSEIVVIPQSESYFAGAEQALGAERMVVGNHAAGVADVGIARRQSRKGIQTGVHAATVGGRVARGSLVEVGGEAGVLYEDFVDRRQLTLYSAAGR